MNNPNFLTRTRTRFTRALRAFRRDESGQVLPIAGIMLVGFLGMSAVALDMGHAVLIQDQLQNDVDAAAMAAAQALPQTTASTIAASYSGASGDYNADPNLTGVTMVSGYPKLLCLNSLKTVGMSCSAPANANAVQVAEQMTLRLPFGTLFGHPTMTLTAVATASMRGAQPSPYNIAIILDTSLSMNSYDSNCGATQGACALNGIQVLLKTLDPCAESLTTCTFTGVNAANSVDRVALFTFPNVSVGTAAVDSACTTPIPSPTTQNGYEHSSTYGNYTMMPDVAWSGVPTGLAYSFPSATATTYAPSGSTTATYQLTPFQSDYRASDTATTLSTTSALSKAAGAVSGCNGIAAPNYDGDIGTYYAGAIYAAQAALTAAKAANPGSQNVIILLSDGDATAPQTFQGYTIMPSPATSSGNYPSWKNQCGQGIIAADAATAAGTRVFTVAYGSKTSGCSTDSSGTYAGVSPCQAMADMASTAQTFFSDYLQSGSNSTCYATAQSVTALSEIFTQIAGDLTYSRLIPNNTT
ncbi:MAG: pilus assembly protein TadG-related protein [Acidobacteriota bacterium]